MFRIATLGSAAALLACLAGCGSDYSPNTYASSAVQQANKVQRGTVIGVRKVGVSANATVGAATGAAVGGIAGAQSPGGGVGAAFGALGGSLVGGLVGTTVAHSSADTDAYEYIVRESTGDLFSVTQTDTVALKLGESVLVIAGNQARIVRDYTVSLPTEPTTPPPTPLPTALPELPPAPLAGAEKPPAPP